jgi:hypothetical protein
MFRRYSCSVEKRERQRDKETETENQRNRDRESERKTGHIRANRHTQREEHSKEKHSISGQPRIMTKQEVCAIGDRKLKVKG